MNVSTSPSRTYVAICSKANFQGYYFKKFTLPEGQTNISTQAAWHFLNNLDAFACIDGCFAYEDFLNISEGATTFKDFASTDT